MYFMVNAAFIRVSKSECTFQIPSFHIFGTVYQNRDVQASVF